MIRYTTMQSYCNWNMWFISQQRKIVMHNSTILKVFQCSAVLCNAMQSNSFKCNSEDGVGRYCGDTMATLLPSSFDWWKHPLKTIFVRTSDLGLNIIKVDFFMGVGHLNVGSFV